jgi:hypothetical protein
MLGIGVLTLPRCLPSPTIESPAEWDFLEKQLPDKNRGEWEKSWMDGGPISFASLNNNKWRLPKINGNITTQYIPQIGGHQQDALPRLLPFLT